jgi:hypothetical protein
VDDLRALELRVAQRSKVVAARDTAVPAEDSLASAGIQPRGHGLVGAWIWCKGVTLARCVAFDAVSGVCILEDGKKGRKERLHGPGSTPFEVLSLPPPFAVAAIACGLCGDPPACARPRAAAAIFAARAWRAESARAPSLWRQLH